MYNACLRGHLATLQPPSSSLVSLTGQESGHLAGHPTASQLKSGQSHRTGVRTPGWPPYSLPAQVWSVSQDRSQDTWLATLQPPSSSLVSLTGQESGHLAGHPTASQLKSGQSSKCIMTFSTWWKIPNQGWWPTRYCCLHKGAGKHPAFCFPSHLVLILLPSTREQGSTQSFPPLPPGAGPTEF